MIPVPLACPTILILCPYYLLFIYSFYVRAYKIKNWWTGQVSNPFFFIFLFLSKDVWTGEAALPRAFKCQQNATRYLSNPFSFPFYFLFPVLYLWPVGTRNATVRGLLSGNKQSRGTLSLNLWSLSLFFLPFSLPTLRMDKEFECGRGEGRERIRAQRWRRVTGDFSHMMWGKEIEIVET